MTRRRWTGWVVLAWAAVVALSTPYAGAQADLAAAAKREGRVVVYGSLTTPGMIHNRIFEGRYGIPVDYWRAASTRILDRVLTEVRAGRPLFDVVVTNSSPMIVMRRFGAFRSYRAAAYETLQTTRPDPESLTSPPFLFIPIGIVYNTRLVRPAEAPRALWDLLEPRWRGQIAMADPAIHTTTAQWLMELRRVLGGRWREFLEGLARQVGTRVESFLPVAERVLRGEFPLGITYIRYVYHFGKEGAPLDYVRLNVFLADSLRIALGAAAQNQNAGKLYIETLLSRAGLLALAQEGDFVALAGVYPPLRDAERLRMMVMDDYGEAEMARARSELERVFDRR